MLELKKFGGAQLAQNRDPRMTRVGYICESISWMNCQLINIFRER